MDNNVVRTTLLCADEKALCYLCASNITKGGLSKN